jgi:hypothetical protein
LDFGLVSADLLKYSLAVSEYVSVRANDTPFTGSDPVATRSSLIQRLRDWEDHGSWQDFFDTYWKLIYAVAIKSGLSEAEARDVVQETVVSTTPSGISSVSVTYAGSPDAPTAAGSYAVTASLNNGNYTASPVSGTLVVAKANQSITFTLPAYGAYGSDIVLGAVASSQLPVGYAATGPATLSGNVLHFTGVGSVTVAASQAGNVDYNAAGNVARTITVNKAALTVTADNLVKVYGQANPALTFTYSGFVNGDTAAAVKGSPKLSTTATTSSTVGTYPITLTLGTLTAANYTFILANGVMAVAAADSTVGAGNVSGKFGAANVTLSASVKAVSPSTATVNEGSVTFTVRNSANVVVGQTVTGTVSKGNATVSFSTGTLARGTYNISVTYADTLGTPNLNNSVGTTTGTLTIK